MSKAERGSTYPEMTGYLQDIQQLGTHSLENPCFISRNRTPNVDHEGLLLSLYINTRKGNKILKLSKDHFLF
ncbi:hypothetical protein QQF64_007341 [Cirrhinus molitorella]|uniref:Uncharacterized protein n=2 Tax=Cirrhinus molitorella TaxID=172907 RepID=A0AA88PLT1_9TELE|nr:hypothetical protein Q8A67_013781 [Cirrhinus molitorella]